MGSQQSVLVIHNVMTQRETWQVLLEVFGGMNTIGAYLDEAMAQFAAHKGEIAAIVVGICFEELCPITESLVARLRDKYKGPMVVASRLQVFRERLRVCGCNHDCDNGDVLDVVKDILEVRV